MTIELIKLKLRKNKKEEDKTIEHIVPDQVLFGLILFEILGPLKNLPNIYADVSFKKEI